MEERTPLWERLWVRMTAAVMYALLGFVLLLVAYQMKYGLPTGSFEEAFLQNRQLAVVQMFAFTAIPTLCGIMAHLERIEQAFAFWILTGILVSGGTALVGLKLQVYQGALMASVFNWWFHSVLGTAIGGFLVNQSELFRGEGDA